MRWVRNQLFVARTACRVASIGGGPGFDLLSLAFLKKHAAYGMSHVPNELACHIEGDVYDIEPAWRETVEALGAGCRPVTARFGTCDIRYGLAAEGNAALAGSVSHVNLFCFNFVCVENTVQPPSTTNRTRTRTRT